MKTSSVAIFAVLVIAAIPLSGLQGADQPNVLPAPSIAGSNYVAPTGPDSWRYVFHNGYWWYWTADSRWLYFTNGQWVSLDTASQPYVSAYQSYDVAPQYAYPDYGGYDEPYYGDWGLGFGYGGYGGYGRGYGGYGGYGGGHGGFGGGGHGGGGHGGGHR